MNSLFVTEEMKFSFGLHFSSESFISFCDYTRRYLFRCKRHANMIATKSAASSIQYFLNSEISTIHCCKTLVSGRAKVLSLKSVN